MVNHYPIVEKSWDVKHFCYPVNANVGCIYFVVGGIKQQPDGSGFIHMPGFPGPV
jgi:hypothetical protein